MQRANKHWTRFFLFVIITESTRFDIKHDFPEPLNLVQQRSENYIFLDAIIFLSTDFFRFLLQSNLYKANTLGAKKTVRLIQVSVLSRFPYFCMFVCQLKGPQFSRNYLLIYGTSEYYPSMKEAEQDVNSIRNSFQDINIQIVYINYTETFVEKKSSIEACFF